MKKLISFFLLSLILFSLCSCAGIGIKATVIGDEYEIPDNGIIEEFLFSSIKDKGEIATFYKYNQSGDGYKWTVFGKDISNPKALNLSVDIATQENGNITVSFGTEEEFGFPAMLSIIKANGAESYVIIEYTDSVNTEVSVTTDQEGRQVISFTPSSVSIQYLLVPQTIETSSVPQENVDESTTITESTTVNNIETTIPTEESTTASIAETTSSIVVPTETLTVEHTTDRKQETTKPAVTRPATTVPVTSPPATQKAVDTCTISIECSSVFNHLDELESAKLSVLPSGGIILKATNVEIKEGETVFEILMRVCRENKIHLEYSGTADTAYIEGINNLYEFDCGSLSGWMYRVNGWYPNYGCGNYTVKNGDIIEWRYTCDLGNDIGGGYIA